MLAKRKETGEMYKVIRMEYYHHISTNEKRLQLVELEKFGIIAGQLFKRIFLVIE